MKYSVRPVSVDIQGHTYQWHLNFDRILDFHWSRQWLTETYEWGYPVPGDRAVDHGGNPRWCWEIQYMIYDIYLASDQELSWFKLKWGDCVTA
jgi:hypothetical protein